MIFCADSLLAGVWCYITSERTFSRRNNEWQVSVNLHFCTEKSVKTRVYVCNNRQLSTASLAAKCIQFLWVLRTVRMLALSLQLVPIVARARQPKWPLQSVRRKHCISTNCEQLPSCFLSFNQLQKQYNTAACNLAPERKRMKANTPATDLNYIANYKCIGVLVLQAFLAAAISGLSVLYKRVHMCSNYFHATSAPAQTIISSKMNSSC